jgi:capsular exopolysaccharide synthesis family protein
MKKKDARRAAGPALLDGTTPFATAEEYRLLRASAEFAAAARAADGECRKIGITSALPDEGKSVTCLNLAITFALTRARVLVLDCDMRKPAAARYLGIGGAPGMSNILAGMCAAQEAVREVGIGGAKLWAVASGDIPPNPSELLGSERMGQALAELSAGYDYIFMDLPPVLPVSDPLVAAKHLTGVAVVVRAGQTKKDEVRAALGRLALAQTNILGFVLNRAQGKGIGGGSRYYAYRYAQE